MKKFSGFDPIQYKKEITKEHISLYEKNINTFREYTDKNKSNVSDTFFCSEYEWNEGRPKCDKQCIDCKKTQNKNKK